MTKDASHRPKQPFHGRGFSSKPVSDILSKGPWHPVVLNEFGFHEADRCIDHVESLQESVLKGLERRGLVARKTTEPSWGEGFKALWRGDPHLQTLERPSVPEVEGIVREHGPCKLTLWSLPPGHASDYTAHVLLLLGTFRRDGRVQGLAVDGDDTQRNAVTDLIREQWRPLATFEAADFPLVQQRLDALGTGLRAEQVVYSLIDLEQALGTGRPAAGPSWSASAEGDALRNERIGRLPDSIQYRSDITVLTPALDGMQPALEEALAAPTEPGATG